MKAKSGPWLLFTRGARLYHHVLWSVSTSARLPKHELRSMLALPDDIKIFNSQRQSLVKAKLIRLTRDLAATKIDGTWWKIPVSKRMRDSEADHHWSWRKLVGMYRNQLAWEALAVQSAGGDVEGAILYRIDAKSQIDAGEGAVYVDRIATSPRNRPWLMDRPKYKGVGTVLLLAAIRHSYSLGLGGRVWLTSLPSEKTREFYRKWGSRLFSRMKMV